MLVGQPPFDGPNAMAILARQSMEAVPSLQVVRHSIPDEVEDAVMRALEKTPADRFATVRDFADALLPGGPRPDGAADVVPSNPGHTAHHSTRRPGSGEPPRARLASGRHPRRAGGSGRGRLGCVARLGRFQPLSQPAPTAELDPHRIAVLYFEEDGPTRLARATWRMA